MRTILSLSLVLLAAGSTAMLAAQALRTRVTVTANMTVPRTTELSR